MRNLSIGLALCLSVLAYLVFFSDQAISAQSIGKTHTTEDYDVLCPDGTTGIACIKLASVELTWDTPTEREDGTPLPISEISHYVIEYQLQGLPLPSTVEVAKTNSKTIHNLPNGTYLFRIATIDSDGVQGQFSQDIIQIL